LRARASCRAAHRCRTRRDELLDDRARVLTEARDELRQLDERAERELDATRTGLARMRQEEGAVGSPSAPRRRRGGQSPEWE